MVPSFMTWNSTNKSMVSNRNAVNVISFSGSSSNGWQLVSSGFSCVTNARPYLAFEQVPDLLLHALTLSQQALVDCQSLETAFAAPHIVDLGCAVLDGTTEEILGVGPDVVTLSLHCRSVLASVSCHPSALPLELFRMA